MNRHIILTIIALLFAVCAFPQMYILNEDFSGASGTTPPAGWNHVLISGTQADKWHFDNPGDRLLSYPFTEPFAVFDSDSISENDEPEEAALETPLFDASTSNYILLHFVHVFDPGIGGLASVEAYDGDTWQVITTFSAEIPSPNAEIVDLSPYCGGLTNGKLRFTWSGNGSGFWAVDNIRIYASLPLDGGIVSIDNPTSPVVPGIQNVEISLGNFGYNTITSTKIDWTVDGIAQPAFNWMGSVGFGQTQENIVIGTYNFQDPALVKVWQSKPNGQNDLNPYNDTVTEYLVAALCGTYTIGGSNPDFDSFSRVAEVLNVAGVNCPVEFIVRDGIYYDMFELRSIPGVSEINTITFRSESGDSTQAVLRIIPEAAKYDPMILINSTSNIVFRNLGFFTGSAVSFANDAMLIQNSTNIRLDGCYIELRNQFDEGLVVQGGSHKIDIIGNNFRCYSARSKAIFITNPSTHDIDITGNQFTGAVDLEFSTIQISGQAYKVNISGNLLESCSRAIHLENADSILIHSNRIDDSNNGVFVDSYCSTIEISGNRLLNIKSHQNAPEGINAICVKNSSTVSVYNNFIHTSGSGPVMGIKIQNVTSGLACFNSINITNTDLNGSSNGIVLTGNNSLQVMNNIFSIKHNGTPVYVSGSLSQLDFDKNDYYSPNLLLGYYNGTYYDEQAAWFAATGLDENSLFCIPFFTSDTDLSINQALLNNYGITIPGITDDIDGTPRNPSNPDIGAKEYNKCATDAGINDVISPENPLAGGVQEVIVQFQNQGTATLTNAVIDWSVNGISQPEYPWSGNLTEGSGTSVSIGSYNFQPGIIYYIEAWTSQPNNTSDCNNHNDTIISRELAVPLCGDYTIGGSNPDFTTPSEAISLLNLAGISCPVNFRIRDGIYYERLVIKSIIGSSASNTVTFSSENNDSTRVTLRLSQDANKYESIIILDGAQNIIFRDLGLFTGTLNSSENNAVLIKGAENILFDGCNFEIKKENDLGIKIQEGCEGIKINGSRMVSQNAKAGIVRVNGQATRGISITGNNITGATEWSIPTISINDTVNAIDISSNVIENCYRAIEIIESDSILIRSNIIKNSNDGIYIGNWCSLIEISRNRLTDINNHENATDGTSAIQAFNSTQVTVFNNFIHTSGSGPVIGINLQNTTQGKIIYNSVNIANRDIQNKSKGLNIKTSTGIIARNNIFKIKFSGTPVYINSTPPQLDFDYNDYYNLNPTIGYFNGNYHPDLESWIAASSMDQHSLSVQPFYSTDTDLSINQALLNNSGIPVSETTIDIEGNPRNPSTPDIGAEEYTPCATDAGVNAFTSPLPPLAGGAGEVRVILQNQGSDPLTSVKINWKVNDDLQPQYSWSGNLAAYANQEVLLGNYDFQAGNAFTIKAWTTSPNGLPDCNLKNDTISSRELSGPLCGTYTIGGTDPDFGTLAQAADVLNASGITCAVEFIIRDGVYDEKIILREIAGASAENTITFRSENADNSLSIIKIDVDAGNYEPLILLNKSKYISFHDLGFHTGTESGIGNCAVQLEGTQYIDIDGCHFKMVNESDNGAIIQGASQDISLAGNRFECIKSNSGAITISGALTRNIDVVDNIIYGAVSWGNTLVKVGSGTRNITIDGNTTDRSYRALYLISSDSVGIRNNIIRNSNAGIYIDNSCDHVKVESNRLINIQSIQNLPDGTSGIFALNTDSLDLFNNFVQSGGTGPVLGINLQNINIGRVYYNSVNITNTDAQGKSRGIYFKNCDSIQLKDNIFNIKSSGIPVDIDVNVTHLSPDYNNYYNPAGIIGKVNGITYSNLVNWGQTVNGDANSLQVNPYFKADTIPLPYQRILNGSGIPVAGMMYDIEGKLRHLQAPDMGCIEFFVDYGVLELLSPDLNCFRPDVDSVIVYLRQFGDVPFDNLKVAYQLDNGEIHIDTIPGPLMYDVTHAFGTTETISAPGEYLFRVWLINTLDDNINNDTLRAWRYSKPPPVVSIQYDNSCTGWEVHFTGNATIEEPYYVDKYEWLFGDGDTSYLQNPIHTYLAAGTYEVTLRAYSNIGCYSDEFIPVTVTPDFQGLQLEYTLVNENCLGDGTGSLELFPSGGNPPYTIYLNDQEIASNPVTNLQPGNYEIKIVDTKNCYRIDSVESQALLIMDPNIIANPISGYTPLTVSFDFTANDPENWVWHFTEDISDTNKQASFTFTEYGNHEVILGVNSGPPYYCTETTTINIFVDIIITIEANSVFTPNGDGNNDFFEVKSVGLKEMKVKIFNQWGNKIFEISEVDGKWDGTTSGGAEAPDGTYYYSLTATGVNEKVYERKGSVLLLRHGAAAYPNPVTDHVRVESYETLLSPVNISVYSVFGQLSHSEIIEDPANISLDLSHLHSGIYILRASDGSRECFVRIIKK